MITIFFVAFLCLLVTGTAAGTTPQVSAGGSHTVAIESDSTLHVWGYNYFGQLGIGIGGYLNIAQSPIQIGSDTWTTMYTGDYHTLAIKSDGTLWACGYNEYGQLGLGYTTPATLPLVDPVTFFTQVGIDTDWESVSGGYSHSVAIKTDGTLYAWGYNDNGVLGVGSTAHHINYPTQVGTDANWSSVTAAERHILALKSDGTLWAWGWNGDGQLGTFDAVTPVTSPVQIGTDTWTSISTGFKHTIGVKSDGTLHAWGYNFYGQLGINNQTQMYTPTPVGTDTNWASVSAGRYFSTAIKSDGTLHTWGDNGHGQLGLGHTDDMYTPTPVGTDTNWSSVTTGNFHTVATKSDRTLYAWGWNDHGQLGLGDTVERTSPQFVTIQLVTDIIAPVIVINTPEDGSTTSDQTPELNVTFNGETIAYAWYNVDNTGNTTPVANTNNLVAALSLTDGDHNVIVYANDSAGNLNSSTVYFTTDSELYIIEEAKLIADDGEASDWLGWSVSVDGDTAVVGAWGDDDKGSDAGAAYVFIRNGDSWVEQAKLTASDGVKYDNFGKSVSVSGDTAVVSANADDSSKGSAYVFIRSGTTWTLQQKLTANDGAEADYFGESVSIYENTIVVGAPWDDDILSYSGSAYIFTRSDNSWTHQEKLNADDPQYDNQFGQSVSIYEDTVAIGANGNDGYNGAVYVFIHNNSGWMQQAKLITSDSRAMGVSVSIYSDTILAGSYGDDRGASHAACEGAAYVFTRSGTVWTQEAKLVASDRANEDYFGTHPGSVSVYGDTAVIGAYQNDDNGASSGSAYIFTRDGTSWTEKSKITASDNAANDYFGTSVSVDEDIIVVGSTGTFGVNDNTGATYVYNLVDEIAPVIIINTPIVGLTTNNPELDVTFNGETVAYAWYNVDNTGNTTPVADTDSLVATLSLPDGNHNVTVYANDSAGNLNSSIVYFEVDTILPNVPTIDVPTNDEILTSSTTWVNGTTDVGTTNVTVYVNGDITNVSVADSGIFNISNVLLGDDGNYEINVSAMDAAGNVNTTNATVTVTVNIPPVITIDTPTAVSKATRSAGQEMYVNFTYVEANPKNYTIQIHNATDIINSTTADTTSSPVNVSFTMNATAADGYYNVTVTMWDNFSNTDVDTEINAVIMDSTSPVITIDIPVEGHTYSTSTVALNVTADESIVAWQYSINGVANVTFTPNETLSSIPDGNHNVTVYANDSAGNIGSAMVNFTVDTTAPVITIDNPVEGHTYSTSTVALNVTADESIIAWQYSINGVANVTFTQNGTLSGILDGNHNVTVYASDSAGNIGSAIVNFTVDTIAPNAPTNLIHTDDAPDGYDNDNSTDISWSAATDASLPVTYRIYRDGVLNDSTQALTYTFIGETEGPHEYNVSANDSAGNINSTNATVQVTVDYTNPVIHNVSLSDTSPAYGQAILVSVNVTDAITNVTSVTAGSTPRIHQSGALWNGTITAGYGVNTVTVTAYDNASNSATNSSLSYTGPAAPTSSSSSSGGVGGSDEPENVEDAVTLRIYMTGGDPSIYNFDNVITSIEVTPDRTGLVAARIEILINQPASITSDLPVGVIYEYVNIFVGTSGLSDSIISFQIPTSWFEENNIDPASVVMYRQYDGEWELLETTMIGQIDGFYQYSSPTPGFSTFMILGQVVDSGVGDTIATPDSGTVADSTPTPEATTTKGTPGFGILLGIMGILIAVYSRKK